MEKEITNMLIDTIKSKLLFWADSVLINEKQFLSEIENKLNITLDNPEEIKQVIEYLGKYIQCKFKKEEWKEIKRIENLFMAISTKTLIENIDLLMNVNSLSQHFDLLLYDYYSLGEIEGYRQALNDVRPNWNILMKYSHKTKCSEGVKEKRWSLREKLINELKEQAESYYKSGGKKWHNDLANAVKENGKFGAEFKSLTLKVILKTVGDVAENYGLKKGIKR